MVHRCGENSGQYLRYTKADRLRLDCCIEYVVIGNSNIENCHLTGVLSRLCGQAIVIKYCITFPFYLHKFRLIVITTEL